MFGWFKKEPAVPPALQQKAEALFYKGINCAQNGDWVGAADCYEQSLSIQKDPGPLYNLSGIRANQVRFVEARELFLEGKELARKKNLFFAGSREEEARYDCVTGLYRDRRSRQEMVEDLRNRNYDYEYVAGRLIDVMLKGDREAEEYFFYDEIDSIKRYDARSDYPELVPLMDAISLQELARHLDTSMERMRKFDSMRYPMYAMLTVYDVPTMRTMRSSILLRLNRLNGYIL
jgi:tetratricopeptide (TPR) repeat protein